jgi:aminodeoxyfutalosine deaminase
MKILAAEYVLPVSSEPLRRGGVAVDEARIADIGTLDEITHLYPDAEVEDFGDAAILPGFVNCHAHLEITSMRGALDDVEHDFRAWLLKLNGLREAMNGEDIESAALAGAQEGAAAGVTCFGDIGRIGKAGVAALKKTGLRGIVFQETEFSPDNRTADADFGSLVERFETLRADETGLVQVGLSPHSPYTVGSQLFEMIAGYSILNNVPITIHAAESAHEIELLSQGTGIFVDVYERFGFEWSSPLCSPIEYLERLGVLSAKPLLAHCVNVSDTDIKRIAANGAKIAHCPKSNAKFGHGYAPFEAFVDNGIAVGLGSDSVASNNICDMLEESRSAALAARNRTDSKRFVSAREVLAAATLGGAQALGLDNIIGTLEQGKQADIVVVSLSNPAQQPVNDIYAALVFSSGRSDVAATFVAGRSVYRK